MYSQRIPKVFVKYLEKLEIKCNKAIIVSSYGSVTAGNAFSQAQKILKRKSIITYGAIALPREHSYKKAFKSYVPSLSYKAELVKFIDDAFSNIKNEKSVSLKSRLVIGMFFTQKFISSITLKIPKVNKEKCVRCNKCVSACPTEAIYVNLNIDINKCIRCQI